MPDIAQMPPDEWKDWLETDFEPDGAFRDIVVRGTTLLDWDRMLRELPGKFPAALHQMVNGDAVDLPYPRSTAEIFSTNDRNFFLGVDLGRVVLHSHFFGIEDIEFDMDPRQIEQWADVQATFDFMIWLGNLLNRPVLITPEGMQDHPIACYQPNMGRLIRIPFSP